MIQITITDPTRDEALRMADYLFTLAGYGKKDGIVSHERVDTGAISHKFETTPGQVADQLKSQIESIAAAESHGCHGGEGATLPKILTQHGGADAIPLSTGVATALTASVNAADVDSAGHPWDERIHASSHAVVSDGTWRLRRNLDPKVLEAVVAERGTLVVAPPPPSLSETAATIAEFLTMPVQSEVPPPPAAAAPVSVGVPPPPPAAAGPLTFAAFMRSVTAAIGAGTIAQTDVAAALAEYGVASIPLLASVHADKIDAVAARLGV